MNDCGSVYHSLASELMATKGEPLQARTIIFIAYCGNAKWQLVDS